MSMNRLTEIDARSTAARLGKKRYASVIPCLRNHIGERYTSSGNCIECIKRWKPADVPKANEYQEIFTLSVVMPNDVPGDDALRCYLVECMVKWFEAKGPRVPFNGLELGVMRATGKPYGIGEFKSLTPEERDTALRRQNG